MKREESNKKNAEPVRVLHLIDRLHGGGVESLLWDIVRLTAPDKVKHFVITFSPDKGDWVYASLLREKGAYGQLPKQKSLKADNKPKVTVVKSKRSINDYNIRRTFRVFIRFNVALWRVLQATIRFRADVIHVHGKYMYPVGLLSKVVFRRPMVHSVPCLFSQMVDGGKSWLPKLYCRFSSLVDCFFSFLPYDELQKLGIPIAKVVPMRGSLDLQEINLVRQNQSQHREAIRETLHLPLNALLAISVGRLDRSKGHMFALEALPVLLEKFPNLYLLVIGEGEQRPELEEKAKTLNISQHVNFLGFQNDLLPFYAAASVYLRTAVFEAENFCSHIAMGMGIPIVGFDPGGENELIRKVGHGILVPNKNVGALSAAVAKVLMLPDQGREMGDRGIAFSQANQDIRLAIEDMAAVYENLKRGVDVHLD